MTIWAVCHATSYEPATHAYEPFTYARYVPVSVAEKFAVTFWVTMLLLLETKETVGAEESFVTVEKADPSVGSMFVTQTTTRFDHSEREEDGTGVTMFESAETTFQEAMEVHDPHAAEGHAYTRYVPVWLELHVTEESTSPLIRAGAMGFTVTTGAVGEFTVTVAEEARSSEEKYASLAFACPSAS